MEEREVTIKQIIGLGYTRDEAINILNGLNPNITEYLYKEKGYPISLNGEIPTFEETMKDTQIYNAYKAKQWLEKACKWLLKGGYFVNSTETIDDFKRAMEED